MATASPTRHLPEDLLSTADRPMPELIEGQFVEREAMGQKSDAVAARILILVGYFVMEQGLGLVNGAQGSYQIFQDDPDKVRIPDVSFTSRARLPKGGEADGHGRVAPDLAIDVISPNDKVVDVSIKVNDFLNAGVRLVWVVNPYSLEVQTHHAERKSRILRKGEILEGEDVLPGFRCPIDQLFDV
ncbi:Uma2 family endonuclease [Singulisphaera rosea]